MKKHGLDSSNVSDMEGSFVSCMYKVEGKWLTGTFGIGMFHHCGGGLVHVHVDNSSIPRQLWYHSDYHIPRQEASEKTCLRQGKISGIPRRMMWHWFGSNQAHDGE